MIIIKNEDDVLELIERLRSESFNIETERKLCNHPLIMAASNDGDCGKLTKKHLQAFAGEQYRIQLSDAISFAALTGYEDFIPSKLHGTSVPADDKLKDGGQKDELFAFLLGGELYASSLLLQFAAFAYCDDNRVADNSINDIDENDAKQIETLLSNYDCHPLGQTYPSYWSHLALTKNNIVGALAVAINFPAWGKACSRFLDGLKKTYPDANIENDFAFIKFFATPIENLDSMVISAVITEVRKRKEVSLSYKEIQNHIRLLQKYELYFWDACWEQGNSDQ